MIQNLIIKQLPVFFYSSWFLEEYILLDWIDGH